MAGEVYGLKILARSVQDIPNNTTRFLVIGQSASPPTGQDRTSLMFCVRDEPGALFRALEPFNRLRHLDEQDREPPLQAQSVGVLLLRRCRRPRLGAAPPARPRASWRGTALCKILGTYPTTAARPELRPGAAVPSGAGCSLPT